MISLLPKGLKSLLQHHSLKASVLWCSAFFMVQLSHLYMTTGKTVALTIWTFVDKVMSLLFNMLSRFVIAIPQCKKKKKISSDLRQPHQSSIPHPSFHLAPLPTSCVFCQLPCSEICNTGALEHHPRLCLRFSLEHHTVVFEKSLNFF